MAGSQQDHSNLSLILSEVLSDIGVNDEMVMRRRNGTLLRESLRDFQFVIANENVNMYFFGSQSEGTTTLGLHSDDDMLVCLDEPHVIEDLGDWKQNVTNVLMVRDETTAPGYCLLQLLREDAPLPVSSAPINAFYKDGEGRILLKNNTYLDILGDGDVRHGPAITSPADEHTRKNDFVPALYCESWPREGRHWLHRRSVSDWPSIQIKAMSERSGCFLVPVGSKINDLNELEWRISTSYAERCLMFSLNITHLQCYVLMKMLLKSHINHGCNKVISSYMCKTAILHCVESTNPVLWQGHNLLLCLNQILRELYYYVLYINCPHFIIPENNLMAGRISAEQQRRLLDNIQHIIDSNGRVLFEIQTDDIDARLQIKLNIIRENLPCAVFIRTRVSGNIMHNIADTIINGHIWSMREFKNVDDIRKVLQSLLCAFKRLKEKYAVSSHLDQEVYRLMLPLLSSTIGSVLASFDIMLNKPFSGIAFGWFKLGVNSDISSGWLKLATVYYITGNHNATETILRYVDQRYDRNLVKPVCACHNDIGASAVPGFDTLADRIGTDAIGSFISYCVMFMPCEFNIVPQELQLEFSRSSQEDRNFWEKQWMAFATVDSLPYLYFLQYKTYGCLNNRREQETALHTFQHIIREERNLFHKETALNLLGQCMEQENLPKEAFNCYERSLLVRPRHNTAQFHRARMLS